MEIKLLITEDLKQLASELLLVDAQKLRADAELSEHGFDSISISQYVNNIGDLYGLSLDLEVLANTPTLSALVDYLYDNYKDEIESYYKNNDNKVKSIADKKDVAEQIPSNQVPAGFESMKLNSISITFINEPIWILNVYDDIEDVKFTDFWNDIQEKSMNYINVSHVNAENFKLIHKAGGYKTTQVLVDIGNNQRVEAVITGSGEPVIMIGGMGMTASATHRQVNALADKFQVIQIHVPGCGLSDPIKQVSVYDIANMVIETCLKLEISMPIHVLSFSWGAMIGQALASEYKEYVSSLVISNGVLEVDNNDEMVNSHTQMANDFKQVDGGEQFIDTFLKSVSLSPIAAYYYKNYYEKGSKYHQNTLSLLGQIEQPTLIIGSDQDTLVPKEFYEMFKDGIKNEEHYQFKGAGHFPFITHTEEYNKIVKEFFEKQMGKVRLSKEEIKQLNQTKLNIETDLTNIDKVYSMISTKLQARCIEQYDKISELMNELCSSYILNFMKQGGVDTAKGSTYEKNDIISMLSILPGYYKCFEYYLQVLRNNNIIIYENNTVQFMDSVDTIRTSTIIKDEIVGINPDIEDFLRLFEYASSHYEEILSGKVTATSVIFNDNYSDFENDIYTDEVVCRLTAANVIDKMIRAKKKGRKLRILEVGGGSGRLLKQILPIVDVPDVEYYFTDVSKYFVSQMQMKADTKYIKYREFDILKTAKEQGIEDNSFDLVVALNVMHVSEQTEDGIRNIKSILKKNGVCMIIELSKDAPWLNMIWGLLEDWWNFKDTDLRPYSPLMEPAQWKQVFEKIGYRNICIAPKDRTRHCFAETSVILGQNI